MCFRQRFIFSQKRQRKSASECSLSQAIAVREKRPFLTKLSKSQSTQFKTHSRLHTPPWLSIPKSSCTPEANHHEVTTGWRGWEQLTWRNTQPRAQRARFPNVSAPAVSSPAQPQHWGRQAWPRPEPIPGDPTGDRSPSLPVQSV